jgi:hypothetical protein
MYDQFVYCTNFQLTPQKILCPGALHLANWIDGKKELEKFVYTFLELMIREDCG